MVQCVGEKVIGSLDVPVQLLRVELFEFALAICPCHLFVH